MLAAVGPTVMTLLFALTVPKELLVSPARGLIEAGLMLGMVAPLLFVVGWLLARRHRRDPQSFASRIARVQDRLELVLRDLGQTERRIVDGRADLDMESSPRAARLLRRELAQDLRLRAAQRRLADKLRASLEQLEIERFRDELGYYEAQRDGRREVSDEAGELRMRLASLRAQLGEGPSASWERALEDARILHRELSRGVQRLHAARRLDPLAHADLTEMPREPEPEAVESGDIEDQTELHLERIDRGFEALEEIDEDLLGEDSGVHRLRIEEDMLATLDEMDEREEQHADNDTQSAESTRNSA